MSYTSQVFKIIPIVAALSATLTALPANAAPLQDDAKQAFQQAYKTFQQAQASDKAAREQLQQLAYDALQKGKAYFGEEHFNTATLAVNYLMLLGPQERIGNEQHEIAQRAASVYQSELPATDLQQLDPLMLAIETMPEAKPEKLAEYEEALNVLFDAWPEEQAASRVILRSQVAEQFMRLGQLRSDMWQQVYQESETLNGMNHPLTLKAAYLSVLNNENAERDDVIATLERVVDADVADNAEALQVQLASYYALTQRYAAAKMDDSLEAALERIKALQAQTNGTADYDFIQGKNPRYPRDEVASGEEGEVLLTFDIDTDGHTQNIQIIEQTTRNFGKSAQEVLKKWRYVPAFVDGKAVVTKEARVELGFSLTTTR